MLFNFMDCLSVLMEWLVEFTVGKSSWCPPAFGYPLLFILSTPIVLLYCAGLLLMGATMLLTPKRFL